MTQAQKTAGTADCGCAAAAEPRLEDLVPVAIVIAAGCEPCAERMVRRALDRGCSPRDVRKTLGIVADLRRQGCFANAVGEEVIGRMERPLAKGRQTLQARLG
ncbi:MAG: carboxymuconolactone decarboxylase family protein [Acidobacteriota bacterium]|nr:carboxymuconolactone decarboxylase family protein [Acidobacteriota bacterium]